MSFMFYLCSSLKELKVSNFNINNANKMDMFSGCSDELEKKFKEKKNIYINIVIFLNTNNFINTLF